MLNLLRLARIARAGLADLAPALTRFVRTPRRRARLAIVFGEDALALLAGFGVVAALAGELFARVGPAFPFKAHVHWGAALLALVFGLRVRRFVFGAPDPRVGFRDLALSLVPALLALLATTVAVDLAFGRGPEANDAFADPSGIGAPLLALTHLAGVVAAVTIAVASLCYRRNWMQAAWDLVLRLAVFKLLLWITALVVIEISIVSTLAGAIIHALTGWRLPDWLAQLADQVSYAVLLLVAYGFIVGGTWRVCRETWPELLATGDVDVVAALERLAKDAPAKRRGAAPARDSRPR